MGKKGRFKLCITKVTVRYFRTDLEMVVRIGIITHTHRVGGKERLGTFYWGVCKRRFLKIFLISWVTR